MVAELGARLRRLREGRGESQLQVANAVGTDPGTVSRWERGKADPQLSQLLKLAKHFRVKPGQLLNETLVSSEPESEEFQKFKRTQIGQIAERNGWLAYIRSIELPVAPTSEIYQDIAYAILRQTEQKP
jgi:transcriptional regulator with XRE-family HTH domain